MKRIALLVGIDRYESEAFDNLEACVDDALAMKEVLERHESQSEGARARRNYHCRTLESESERITTESLGKAIEQTLGQLIDGGEVLIYFSGHGVARENDGYLVTQDGTREAPGFPMSRLMELANHSRNAAVVIILDCCHSGQIGNVTDSEGFKEAVIGPNVTVLAASGDSQKSSQGGRYSLFTRLLLEAMNGGAADICGDVSAASIYAYVEQALGVWEQRPVYKSYARTLSPLRKCKPQVAPETLARLPDYFYEPDETYQLDPTYEIEVKQAKPEFDPDPANVAVFNDFKDLRNGGLLTTTDGDDLYWTALKSGYVQLTPKGRLFWKRAERGDF